MGNEKADAVYSARSSGAGSDASKHSGTESSPGSRLGYQCRQSRGYPRGGRWGVDHYHFADEFGDQPSSVHPTNLWRFRNSTGASFPERRDPNGPWHAIGAYWDDPRGRSRKLQGTRYSQFNHNRLGVDRSELNRLDWRSGTFQIPDGPGGDGAA